MVQEAADALVDSDTGLKLSMEMNGLLLLKANEGADVLRKAGSTTSVGSVSFAACPTIGNIAAR